MAVIQVALDVLELDRAVEIAKMAVEGGADWIEVGTPLIKSEGMDAVRRLRVEFAHRVIVADMKTSDTGAVEVEMAAKAGADVVSVLASCDDATIEDALRSAHRYGVRLMADLLGVDEPPERARELEALGVPIMVVHTGVDQQMVGAEPLTVLDEVRRVVGCELAVAGGLDDAGAARAARMGADIIIVGSYITRSADPALSARAVKRAVEDEKATERPRDRGADVVDMLLSVSTPNLSDALHRKPCLHVRPITPCKIAGRVLTVLTLGGDWAKAVEAIDMAERGDVLVIAGDDSTAVWGELATLSAMNRGLGGVVVYGAVRDVEEIRALGFPVFAKRFVSNAGEPKGFGEVGVELSLEGQSVKTGDYVLADDNGAVIVPRERAYEAAKRAVEVSKLESRLRAEIESGGTLSQVSQLLRWEKRR
ncbi:MAG: 3-hexulose-6-phosphate synthase [Methermicoccaceae archaeon]